MHVDISTGAHAPRSTQHVVYSVVNYISLILRVLLIM